MVRWPDMGEPLPKKQKLSDVVEPGKLSEWVKGELETMEYSAEVVTSVTAALAGYTRVSLAEASVTDLVTVIKEKLEDSAMITAIAQSLCHRIHPELLPPATAPWL